MARMNLHDKDWADFVGDIQNRSDKAFPDLPEEARERLSLECFLDQITDPQIAYSARRTSPKTVDEVVACTLLMETCKVRAYKPKRVNIVDQTPFIIQHPVENTGAA